jgi:hypothetical protein
MALTDAMLLKSQRLLEEFAMLDLGEGDNQINSGPAADSVRHDTACSATACDEPESEEMLSPSHWAVANSKAAATVEVPVQFMELLVDMWQQRQETRGNKAEHAALTAALSGKQLLQEHVDLAQHDFETGCSVTTTAPSSPDISEACSVRSSSSDVRLSAKDVELIKMLRAALGGAVPSRDCDARTAPASRRASMAGVTRQLSASAGSYSVPSPSPFFPVVSRQVSGAVSSFPFPDSTPTSLVRTSPMRPTAQVSHSLPLLSPRGGVPCCCPSPRVPQMLIPIMPEARCAGRAVPTLQMRSVAVTTTTTTVHQFLAVC